MRPDISLTTSAFYVLLSLSVEDRHAGEILEDVAFSSAGRVKMGAAVLNAALKRLLETGMIVGLEGSSYRLTHQGRTMLAAELERMEHALRFARSGPKARNRG